MNKAEQLINRVEHSILCANNRQTKLTEQQLNPLLLPGMSGKKSRIMLNELIFPDTNYLEVGVWKGSTFVSALYGNQPNTAFAIDSFIQFGDVEVDFLENTRKHNLPEFKLFREDSFTLSDETKSQLKDINTYFYDGEHEAHNQAGALTYYMPYLADTFIFLVDDWNWDKVKQGTRDGIKNNNLKVHQEWELISGGGDHENWWNAWYVAVLSKN
jgi:hypothetical protein